MNSLTANQAKRSFIRFAENASEKQECLRITKNMMILIYQQLDIFMDL